MKDLYFQYKKVGKKFKIYTNLTEKMLKYINEYDEEWILCALSILLKKVNAIGEDAKLKYKELCEKNGELLYNAAMICNGIYEEDAEMKNYDLYAKTLRDIGDEIREGLNDNKR